MESTSYPDEEGEKQWGILVSYSGEEGEAEWEVQGGGG